jgi:hypothetical protein
MAVGDVREYLDHNEWEIALDILVELGEDFATTTPWWDLLIDAAQQMRLGRTTAWCQWRRSETSHGIIRADLQLLATAEGGRGTPIPGDGKLRPLWDLGHLTPAGERDFRIAFIWVEYAPELAPGTTGPVRLLPLDPAPWQQLRPGDAITMHERRPVTGTATILQVTPPQVDI